MLPCHCQTASMANWNLGLAFISPFLDTPDLPFSSSNGFISGKQVGRDTRASVHHPTTHTISRTSGWIGMALVKVLTSPTTFFAPQPFGIWGPPDCPLRPLHVSPSGDCKLMPVKNGNGKYRCHIYAELGVIVPRCNAESTAAGQLNFFSLGALSFVLVVASHHGLFGNRPPSTNNAQGTFHMPWQCRTVDGTSSTTNCRAQRSQNYGQYRMAIGHHPLECLCIMRVTWLPAKLIKEPGCGRTFLPRLSLELGRMYCTVLRTKMGFYKWRSRIVPASPYGGLDMPFILVVSIRHLFGFGFHAHGEAYLS